MDYINIIDELSDYTYIKLKNIPRNLFPYCVGILKNYSSWGYENKYWIVNNSDLKRLTTEIIDFIYENKRNGCGLIIYDVKNYIEIEMYRLKNDNRKLELSNELIKYLKTISIKLNKKIYKEGFSNY